MQYITNTLEFKIEENTVISLGKFDGLHRGHELLMKNLIQKKQEHGYQAVVFTFDIPPPRRGRGCGGTCTYDERRETLDF